MFDLARLTGSLPYQVEYRATTGSTNDLARELAAALPPDERLLVLADEQTAGRGRGGNRWWTGPQSLALSLLFDPARQGIELRYRAMTALAAACAIVDVAADRAPSSTVGLHWPNDVFLDGRKLAGILVEVLPDGRNIVGIGVNVNNTTADAPDEVRHLATTLADATGTVHDRTLLAIDLLERFEQLLDELAAAPRAVGRRSDELCLQRGSTLTLDLAGARHSGLCQGIADDGGLILETSNGRETFYSGVVVKR